MGTIAIAMNGTPQFDWDGDEITAQRILEAFPRGAAHAGMAPREMALNCLALLGGDSKAFLEQDPAGREFGMMAVIWLILTSETGNIEHPGKVGDYIGNTDFRADIRFESPLQRGSSFNILILARPGFDS